MDICRHFFNLYRSSFQQARDYFPLGCFSFHPTQQGEVVILRRSVWTRYRERAVHFSQEFVDLAKLQNKIRHSFTKTSSGMWKIPVINDQTSPSCHKLFRHDPHSLFYRRESIPMDFLGFYTTVAAFCWPSAARPRAAVSRALHWRRWNSPGDTSGENARRPTDP